jgi:hypothetical protein
VRGLERGVREFRETSGEEFRDDESSSASSSSF